MLEIVREAWVALTILPPLNHHWNESGNEPDALTLKVTVEPAEYPKYLAKAYGEEKFAKPRNVIGLAKDLPVPEMEQLMLANMQVTDADMRILADQRGQKVKDYLLESGRIPADRVFLLAPKLSAEGIKDKGKPTRVDFALK